MILPNDILPYPKAAGRRPVKTANTGKAAILTSSPYKDELNASLEAKQLKLPTSKLPPLKGKGLLKGCEKGRQNQRKQWRWKKSCMLLLRRWFSRQQAWWPVDSVQFLPERGARSLRSTNQQNPLLHLWSVFGNIIPF